MQPMDKIAIKTTVAGLNEIYALCIELLVSAASLDLVLPVYVVRELTSRIAKRNLPWLPPDKAVVLQLSAAEAVAVRTLILGENLPSVMMPTARKVLSVIDPKMPVIVNLLLQEAAKPRVADDHLIV